jgi:hypothetical protein
MLGEGIQHLKNVGEFLRIVVGGDEPVHLFRQLVPQTGTVLINVSDIGDRLQALGPDDLRDLVADQLALAQTQTAGRLRFPAVPAFHPAGIPYQ